MLEKPKGKGCSFQEKASRPWGKEADLSARSIDQGAKKADFRIRIF